MSFLKSQFVFNRKQRIGILSLVALLIGLLIFKISYYSENENLLDVNSPDVLAIQHQIDSLRLIAIEKDKPKVYPFNPNYITDYKAYTLGMSTVEFDRLKAFRDKGQWINSINDFKKVTKISDSVLATFSQNFKFPDWVGKSKSKSNFKKNVIREHTQKTYAQKIDLNIATAAQLQQVSGIGPAISKRIIAYRDQQLEGFSDDTQLAQVWGLDSVVLKRALHMFTVKTPKIINKINVNTASASDIATIKGVNFELAKEIWEFRIVRESIVNLDELSKIDGMTAGKLALIKLYLTAD